LKNNKEVLIPFVKEIVPVVDIKKKFILITPPSGLLEL
jgi:16S rRNA processing protein RimM